MLRRVGLQLLLSYAQLAGQLEDFLQDVVGGGFLVFQVLQVLALEKNQVG